MRKKKKTWPWILPRWKTKSHGFLFPRKRPCWVLQVFAKTHCKQQIFNEIFEVKYTSFFKKRNPLNLKFSSTGSLFSLAGSAFDASCCALLRYGKKPRLFRFLQEVFWFRWKNTFCWITPQIKKNLVVSLKITKPHTFLYPLVLNRTQNKWVLWEILQVKCKKKRNTLLQISPQLFFCLMLPTARSMRNCVPYKNS